MKTFVLNFLSVILLICSATIVLGQSYSINGDLGIDTVPQHKLDVNGDGRFKGELLLDDNLRIPVLASNDSLIEKLVYIDENGRMQRVGGGGLPAFALQINKFPCLSEVGQDPIIFWNAGPGKITAFDETCGTPDVGIGVANPLARLHVRGSSYFTGQMGIGALNEGSAKLQIRTGEASKGILLQGNSIENDEIIQKDVFHVYGNGIVKMHHVPIESNAFSIRNSTGETDVFSVFGKGHVRLKIDPSDDYAFKVESISGQEAFELKRNGKMRLKGMGAESDAFIIQGETDGSPNIILRGNGQASLKGMTPSSHALEIKYSESNAENVIITGDGRTHLRGMSPSSTAFEITNSESAEPNIEIQGDGRTTMRGMGSGDGLTIQGDLEEENRVVLKGGGQIEQYVTGNNGNRAFQLRNLSLTGDQELFNVRNNGRIQLKYIGDNDGDEVFRIERGNAPQIDQNSHILSVRAYGRTQINFTGTGSQTAFGIKNGDDSSSDYLFHVKGDGHVSAAAVHVRELGNFPDYVFEPGYELMPLGKLRAHIAQHKRLPNMPSADEVERNGVDLGEMNRLLVEKVEELTLYVLDLEERLKAVESK